MVIGDFNVRIGNLINGNHKEVSRGGKILNKMIKIRKLILTNSTEKCQGLWTRIATLDPENINRKSILDYAVVNQKCYHKIQNIVIDEDRNHVIERITNNAIKESDHNAIIVNLNLKLGIQSIDNVKGKGAFSWCIPDKSLNHFKTCTEGLPVKSMNINIDETYMEWEDAVNSLMDKCFKKKFKGKNKNNLEQCKDRKMLRSRKKYLKKQLTKYRDTNDIFKADRIKIKIKLQNQKIMKLTHRKKIEKLEANMKK